MRKGYIFSPVKSYSFVRIRNLALSVVGYYLMQAGGTFNKQFHIFPKENFTEFQISAFVSIILVFLFKRSPIIHVGSCFVDVHSYHFQSNLYLFLHFLLMFKFPSLPSSISFRACCVGFVSVSFSEFFHFSSKAFSLLIYEIFKKILIFDAVSQLMILSFMLL